MVYLDNQSTTPVDSGVLKKMLPYFYTNYANPHSIEHRPGRISNRAILRARKNIALLINSHADEIIFTSGATEANNLAIKGAALFRKKRKNHLITVNTEHKCVLESFRKLELDGFKTTILNVNEDGLINLDKLKIAINRNTILVSVMFANNETGVIQPIKKIANICRERNVLFHTDAAQAVGKLKINVKDLGVDLLSMSAHKMYGPKGVGGLYIKSKPRVRLIPIIDGGGQEQNIRSGTLPTPLCVGFGESARICQSRMDKEFKKTKSLRDYLFKRLKENISGLHLNGTMKYRLPSNLNLSIDGVEAFLLIKNLKNVFISSGSACNTNELENSYVLSGMGFGKNRTETAVRMAVGRYTSKKDVDLAVYEIAKTVKSIRANLKSKNYND